MTKDKSILDQVKKIHVPEPGTGEFVTMPSVEALHEWLKLNHLKVKGWRGNYLEVVADDATETSLLEAK